MPLTRPVFDNSDLPSDVGVCLGEILRLVKGVVLAVEKLRSEQEIMKEQLKIVDRKLDSVVDDNKILRNEIADARGKTDVILNAIKEDCETLKKQSSNIFSNVNLQEKESDEGQNTIPQQLLEFNVSKDWKTLRRWLVTSLEQGSTAHRQLQHVPEDCQDPLYTIGRLGLVDLASHLLQGNTLLEFTDSDEDTMLHGAAHGGSLQLVEALLRRGAHVDARNKYGRTPLMRAADRGHLDVVKCLVRAGADTTAKSKAGLRALDYARKNNRDPVVQFLT